jgi:hypothetical protein
LTPQGGKAYLKRIQKLCRNVLPWDRRRWKAETRAYKQHWTHVHDLPIRRAGIPAMRRIFALPVLGKILSAFYHKFFAKKQRGQIL